MASAPTSSEQVPDPALEAFPLPLVQPGYTQATLRLLIHANPGIGKTMLCGTAADDPRTHPVLYIDTEGGTLTIRDKDVQVVRVTTFEDIQKIIQHLRRQKHQFKSVVVDSLTELQKLIMTGIMREQAVNSGRPRDPDIPEMRDWAKNTERVRRVVRAFRDLPGVHVFFTCLSREVKDDATGVVTVKPMLPGQLADEVAGFIDIVGWLHVSKEKVQEADGAKSTKIQRELMFQPLTSVIVKDRSNVLGSVMTEPTIPKILNKVLGTAKEG